VAEESRTEGNQRVAARKPQEVYHEPSPVRRHRYALTGMSSPASPHWYIVTGKSSPVYGHW